MYAPDGAPALAMSSILSDGYSFEGKSVKGSVVNSANIQQFAADADLAIVPANLAAVLFNKGTDIKVIATVTHGNLYFIGNSDASNIDDLSKLKGKVIFCIGQGSVPALIFEKLLKDSNIDYVVDSDAAAVTPQEGKAVLCYSSDGSEVIRLIKSKESADYYGIVGEPAVSIAAKKNGLEEKGDLQALNGGSYSQAVLIAKSSIAKDKSFIDGLLAAMQSNASNISSSDEGAKGAYEAIKNNYPSTSLAAAITGNIVSRCNVKITSISGDEGYAEYIATLNAVFEIKPAALGGSVPAKDSGLYYGRG